MGQRMSAPGRPVAANAAEAARLMNAGDLGAAAECARRVLAAKPADAEARLVMGVIEARQGNSDAAVVHLRQAVQLRPSSGPAHYNLAVVLHRRGDAAEAEHHYLAAIEREPRQGPNHNNLGTLYQDQGDLTKARQSFERAVACDPSKETYVVNLYSACRKLGAMADLEALTKKSLQRWPANAVHWIYRAEALFHIGRLEEGWSCYAWRFKASDNPVVSRAAPGVPEWAGEDLKGKSILVWTEQGPGDEVMYATMLDDLRAKVGRLGVRCSERLAALLRRSLPGIEVLEWSAQPASAYDVQASLADLAKRLRPNLNSFDGVPACLVADPDRVQALRQAYRGAGSELVVGIAWRSIGVLDDRSKTVGLEHWGPLFALPGVRFIDLQYGDTADERAAVMREFGVTIHKDGTVDPLRDLDTYAAQVAAMDMVVCSSNTAAHFAGALGVPTHCMLPATAGWGRRWYWFDRYGRCAWYPSMSLWHQSAAGQWLDPVRCATFAVARELCRRGATTEVGHFLTRLATSYRNGGYSDAADAVLKDLATLPGCEANACFELGCQAKQAGRADEALSYFDRALTFSPDAWATLNMKGVVLASQDRYVEAEPVYRRAIDLAPQNAEPYNNLATALRRMGRGVEADALYKQADDRKPDHAGILLNLATNLTEISRQDEAIGYFDRLLALQPDYAEAHHSRGFALMASLRFAEGWPELWWRHRTVKPEDQPVLFQNEARLPKWSGQDLRGKKILVWTEHGLGDEILTVSMLPEVMSKARSVTLICSERLAPLFSRSFPGVVVLGMRNPADPRILADVRVEDFDFQLSISELGAAARPSASSFPDRESFLAADPVLRDRIAGRTRRTPGELVVGVSWASANPEVGGLKSLGLARILEQVRRVAGAAPIRVVSLQYGDHAAEIAAAAAATGVEVLRDGLIDPVRDVDAFAAQVAAMDAVITISNTTAHVAGALGVPTFLLLPYNRGRHWYWVRALAHCPWYPSVRYCVQRDDGTWDDALQRCKAGLDEMTPSNA
jgi:tetratricopeptide (TPR) repeat protein